MSEQKIAAAFVAAVERELVVRAFLVAFNERDFSAMAALVDKDMNYEPKSCERVVGKPAVLRVFAGLFENIAKFEFNPRYVAVAGETVLMEQTITVRFDNEPERQMVGMANFTVRGDVITLWRQLHG